MGRIIDEMLCVRARRVTCNGRPPAQAQAIQYVIHPKGSVDIPSCNANGLQVLHAPTHYRCPMAARSAATWASESARRKEAMYVGSASKFDPYYDKYTDLQAEMRLLKDKLNRTEKVGCRCGFGEK